MRHSYQSEKFANARRTLMLPNPKGEAFSIAGAFHQCSLGLMGVNRKLLDHYAQDLLAKLDKIMDTSGLADAAEKGLWQVKAETLTVNEKSELSHIVDELANWFSNN